MASKATVTFSKAYSEEEMDQLSSMMEQMVTTAEQKLEESKPRVWVEGKRQTVYVREPAAAKSLSDAVTVKCITWDYVLSPDKKSALVRYGGSIFNKYDKVHNNCCVSGDGETGSTAGVVDHKDAASQCSMKSTSNNKPSVFKKKELYSTAMARYSSWPVTFTVNFRQIVKHRPVLATVTHTYDNGTQVEELMQTTEPYEVSREDQVLHAVKKMLADSENGGCSSRKRMTPEEKKAHRARDTTDMHSISSMSTIRNDRGMCNARSCEKTHM